MLDSSFMIKKLGNNFEKLTSDYKQIAVKSAMLDMTEKSDEKKKTTSNENI